MVELLKDLAERICPNSLHSGKSISLIKYEMKFLIAIAGRVFCIPATNGTV